MPLAIAARTLIPYILCAIGSLVGIGGTAYGVDQHLKRKKEQEIYQATLVRLKKRMAEMEVKLAEFRRRFGEKCDQVRQMAVEIERLRKEIAQMEKRAA